MKWIKATESETWDNTTAVRFAHTKFILCDPKSFVKTYPHRLDTLEVLDESSSPQEAGWVKVEDGLPVKLERVLLNINSLGENYTCIGKMKENNFYYKDRGSAFKPMETVTHWQPLPSPPKN